MSTAGRPVVLSATEASWLLVHFVGDAEDLVAMKG